MCTDFTVYDFLWIKTIKYTSYDDMLRQRLIYLSNDMSSYMDAYNTTRLSMLATNNFSCSYFCEF